MACVKKLAFMTSTKISQIMAKSDACSGASEEYFDFFLPCEVAPWSALEASVH